MEDNQKIEFIERLQNIDPIANKSALYALMDDLGIKYRKTNCHKCLRDYFNICREELRLTESAADDSDFNGTDGPVTGFVWTYRRGIRWKGRDFGPGSSQRDLTYFVANHPGWTDFVKLKRD